VLGVVLLFSGIVCVHVYVYSALLWPLNTLPLKILGLTLEVSFVLALLSLVGINVFGPGRVTLEAHQGTKLPAEVRSALDIGKFRAEGPFGSEDGWCSVCDRWKPVFAHHCQHCGRCSMWMDHHCFYAAQCVGFLNHRCFIVFLLYSQLVIVLLVICMLQYFASAPSLDLWASMPLTALGLLCFELEQRLVKQVTSLMFKLRCGWPYRVLMNKFAQVYKHAGSIEERIFGAQQQTNSKPSARSAERQMKLLDDFQHSGRRLQRPTRRGLRGLCATEGILEGLVFLFGSPPSWRWLLPLVPGGTGNSLELAMWNPDVCEAWAAFSRALEKLEHSIAAK